MDVLIIYKEKKEYWILSKMLPQAIALAQLNPINKLPKLCAILATRDGHIFLGYNRYKTHPLQARFGKNDRAIYLHAEIDAIVQAARGRSDIRGGRMWVARVLRDGQPALARPCAGCMRALIHFGIEEVEWTE